MDPAAAALGGLALAGLLVGLVLGGLWLAYRAGQSGEHEARAADVARLEVELRTCAERCDRAEALAEHRRESLVEAGKRALARAAGARADAERAARIDDAADAAGLEPSVGAVDAAVDRLLRSDGRGRPGPTAGDSDAPGAQGV